jgi:hypothetical protein
VIGSGRLASETRSVSGFSAVNHTCFGDVDIAWGDEESLSGEAEDNLLPRIITEVRGGTLVIRVESEHDLRPTRPVRYTLVMRTLGQIEISGSGSVTAPAIAAERLTVTNSGSGTLTAAGQVEQLTANVSGSGKVRLGDLRATRAEATVSGSGTLTVWPSQALRAHLSGSGTLEYYGSPAEFTQEIDGAGRVTKLGDK